MAYRLRAFIAEKHQLEGLAKRLDGACVVDLNGVLGIIPLLDAVEGKLPIGGTPPVAGLRLSQALAGCAEEASAEGPLAYVEAEYTAKKEFQASIVWAGGKVVSGPLIDATNWDPREPSVCERPVNAALRLLGISAVGFDDEWDAVGMARHTDTVDWAP